MPYRDCTLLKGPAGRLKKIAVTGLPIYEAARELCAKMGMEPPWTV